METKTIKRRNINLKRFTLVSVIKYGFILLITPISFSEEI
jgi:hypothetical protein